MKMETCRLMVLSAIADLPAKAKLLNFMQFNGKYGCSVCEQEGKVVPVGRGQTRVYEYINCPPQRSHLKCYELGKKALRKETASILPYIEIYLMTVCSNHYLILQVCTGVKGLSALHILPSFDIVNGAPIDYMHCVLEGIGKRLCSKWFTPSSNQYYLGRHIELLNERLLSIKPPDLISRTPQSLNNRKSWKGK